MNRRRTYGGWDGMEFVENFIIGNHDNSIGTYKWIDYNPDTDRYFIVSCGGQNNNINNQQICFTFDWIRLSNAGSIEIKLNGNLGVRYFRNEGYIGLYNNGVSNQYSYITVFRY